MNFKKIVVLITIVTSLLAGCFVSAGETQKEQIIAQYFAIFDFKPSDQSWKEILKTAPFDKANRYYIGFTWVRNGEMVLNDAKKGDSQLIKELTAKIRKENPKAEILICSGFDSDGEMYKEAAKNPDKFAESVVNFIKEYKLDGYDMDWENGIDSGAMLELIKALHKAFEPNNYILTMALWQSTSTKNFDKYKDQIGEISNYIEQINIMSYGNGRTVKESAEAYNKYGVPYSKLIGGIETEIDYPETDGVDTLGKDGTIKQKCDEAKELGLAGMMSWRMDNDYRPLDKDGKAYGISTYKGALEMHKWMTTTPSFWDRICSIFE